MWKRHFYSNVINRKKSKHVDNTAQFTPALSVPGTWKKRARKQHQKPVFIDFSQVPYMKHETQVPIPTKSPSRARTGSHASKLWYLHPSSHPLSPQTSTHFTVTAALLTDCTWAQRKVQFSSASVRSFSPRDTIPRCSLVPRPFLHLTPHICVIADLCSRGRARGPLFQWYAGSVIQPAQGNDPARTVHRMQNGDSLLQLRCSQGGGGNKTLLLQMLHIYVIYVMWNTLQMLAGMGLKLSVC